MRVNNILAIGLLFVVIPGLWVAQGLRVIELPGEVIGALIATWTLVAQFFFRKKPNEANGS